MNTRYLDEDKAMSAEIVAEFGEGWLPPEPTVEIKEPTAMPGDEVVFVNYRARRNNSQAGIVIHVETHWSNTSDYRHRYTVRPQGKNYTVTVAEVRPILQPINNH